MKCSFLKTGLWILVSCTLLLLGACGGDSGDSSGTGTLQVALTDQVDPNLKEVVISIKEVRVVPSGQEGGSDSGLPLIKTFEPSLVVNVLDLAYQQEILGEALVPAGNYNQVRLVLDTNVEGEVPVNYVKFQDETVASLDSEDFALTTPSAQTSGLKLVGKFTVSPGEINAIALDFDPGKAIHESSINKWILKPTGIRIIQLEDVLPQYGAIFGVVMSGAEIVSDAIVSVVPEGQDNPIATGTVIPEDGSFRALVPEGTYVINVDAEGFAPYSSDPETFNAVIGEDTDAGVFDLTSIAPAGVQAN